MNQCELVSAHTVNHICMNQGNWQLSEHSSSPVVMVPFGLCYFAITDGHLTSRGDLIRTILPAVAASLLSCGLSVYMRDVGCGCASSGEFIYICECVDHIVN